MNELSKSKYKSDFGLTRKPGLSNKRWKKAKKRRKQAFLKAWEVRNFEIQLYWKRATYFWAFMLSISTAYFAVTLANANDLSALQYWIGCTGLIVATAWHLTNKGSKSWIRSWEKQVDMLENKYTGPLYKTVGMDTTYSVSKINELVSLWFIILWVVLLAHHVISNDLINCFCNTSQIEIEHWIATLLTGWFLWQMYFGDGRGQFGYKRFKMFRRKVDL